MFLDDSEVYPLRDNNQLLHNILFQIEIDAGVKAVFNTELKEFRKEIKTTTCLVFTINWSVESNLRMLTPIHFCQPS